MEQQELMEILDQRLASVDSSKVTANNTGFKNLPDGYYNCELVEATLTTSKSNKVMIKGKFKVFEAGLKEVFDETTGSSELVISKGSKNRLIWINWLFDTDANTEKFISDMKKFEDEDGNQILPEEAFKMSSMLLDSLDAIKGLHVYIMLQTVEKNGEENQYSNLISWSRAKQLDLPL